MRSSGPGHGGLVDYHGGVGRAVAPTGGFPRSGDLLHYFEPRRVDRAERCVAGREWTVLVNEEELAATGARTAVGHRHCARRICDHVLGVLLAEGTEVLIGELVARP